MNKEMGVGREHLVQKTKILAEKRRMIRKRYSFNKKLSQDDSGGGWKLRVWHRKGRGEKCNCYLVKCGCCDNKVEIYYDEDSLEINGVNANLNEWRVILLPLLKKTFSKKLKKSFRVDATEKCFAFFLAF